MLVGEGMDDQGTSVQKSSNDMPDLNEVDDIVQNHGAIQSDGAVEDPELGLTFDNEKAVLEFYTEYAKAKGFGVTRRSSRTDDGGELKYLTLACARQGKTQSKTRNPLKPNSVTGLDCKAKINVTHRLDGKFQLTTVILDHNHKLSPQKSRLFRCNKKIDMYVKRRLELNDQAGIRVNKNYNSFVVAAGGHDNLTFGEKECRNYLEKVRRLKLGAGDAEAVHDYFVKMQSENPNFFSVMDLDDESHLRNVFWADARSRAVYESFGDVITFDTTYLTNKYAMPFACFVGVNHHGQSVLLGCALLSNEDKDTFVWLFKAWLACMSNRQPKAIITDQAKAIQNAVEEVFAEARYRWCLWHIMKKIPEKFGSFDEYDDIRKAIGNAVYNSITVKEFEDAWKVLIDSYDLSDNEWLNGLYINRHRWVPAFVKDTFWAGMSTTQRSESMNSFFDGYVNSKTSLKQFVGQYENALRDKVEKEIQSDFHSFNSTIPCITSYDIEAQFQSVYTNSKFQEFQEELTKKMYCEHMFIRKEGAIETYEVTEDVHIMDGWRKDITYTVLFNAEEFEVQCSCRHFEFRGILCRHVLRLVIYKKIKAVSSQYILDRWKKNVKRRHDFIRCTYGGMDDSPVAKRFDSLCNSFFEVAEMCAISDDSCNALSEAIGNLKIQFSSSFDPDSNKTQDGTKENLLCDVNNASKTILSPLKVRSVGRPPSKRKESKVDKIIRQKREKKEREEKKKEKKDCSLNSKKKGRSRKTKSLGPKEVYSNSPILLQDEMGHMEQSGQATYMDGWTCSSMVQDSYDFAIGSANRTSSFVPTMPFGDSPAMTIPKFPGEFTSLMFEVQQGSGALSTSEMLYNGGMAGLNDIGKHN